jgi:hypothetical protein
MPPCVPLPLQKPTFDEVGDRDIAQPQVWKKPVQKMSWQAISFASVVVEKTCVGCHLGGYHKELIHVFLETDIWRRRRRERLV